MLEIPIKYPCGVWNQIKFFNRFTAAAAIDVTN